MSSHRTCRVCEFREPGVNGKSAKCSKFNKDIKRDKPRCSTSFLERNPKKVLDKVS